LTTRQAQELRRAFAAIGDAKAALDAAARREDEPDE
jgi:hypothetical protein